MSGSTPHEDIEWVTSPTATPMELFVEGKIDAFLAFPPEPQELRARKTRPHDPQQCRPTARGRSTSAACWPATGVHPSYPVATKRVLRAILKAADLCAPSRMGRAG